MVNQMLTRRRQQSLRRSAERGFTLVEMLVVISIIGLIMALVGPRVLNFLAESKVKAAKIQIESLTSALDLYALDAGHYPSSSEGLEALMQRHWRRGELERPLFERQCGAQRPVGKAIHLSLAGTARSVRHPVLWRGWTRRRHRCSSRYHQLD